MRFLSVFVAFLVFGKSSFAQLIINFPKERMVYQRNAQNKANIIIQGNYTGNFDLVEARLTSLDGTGQPILPLFTTSWTTIVACPQAGGFSGAIFNQTAGWYNLEIKVSNAGLPIEPITTMKVGIGEVFVIAGQSNATGEKPKKDTTIYQPTDDRVNCINLYDTTTTNTPPMVFSHLDSYSNIAPIGVTAWCWGVMGQQIATNWSVPVLYFNVALGATSIFDWRASANGGTDICGCRPYDQLKKVLTTYCSKTGLRAILWHQGENDNGNFGNSLPPSIYKDNMKQVIDKSRADFQQNISWVVAKVSRVKDVVNTNVTAGQQMIIDSLNYNNYLGPISDDIQPSEAERDIGGVHLWGQGLIDIGNSWWASVNNPNFLTNSIPATSTISITGCYSVKSGDWDEPSTWSGGRVPAISDDVNICSNHIVTLNSIGHLHSINLLGTLQLGILGELAFDH
jgi:Carbohydrate esterase, sialic acid-specific acetylesterase